MSGSTGSLVAPAAGTAASDDAGSGGPYARAAYLLVFLAGLAWTASLMARSPGVANHDEVALVLAARDVWTYPGHLLSHKGRPLNMLVYTVPARWGMNGARIASLLISCGTVLLLTRLARRLGLQWLFLVPLFLWFQPWFADLSYTAMSEVPFAFLLVLALVLAVEEHDLTASFAFGLLPLVRNEGIAITGAWCLYRLIRRQPGDVALSVAPGLLYEGLYRLAFHQSVIAVVYSTPRPTTFYGRGGWGHFLPALLRGAGPAVLALAALALLPRRLAPGAVRNTRGEIVVAAGYAIYFGVHTVLFRFGLFASGGYALFLLPLAPGVAVAAALGAERFVAAAGQLGNSLRAAARPVASTIAAAMIALAAAAAIAATINVLPRPLDRDGVAIEQASSWLHAHGYPRTGVIATHPWFFLFYEYPRRVQLTPPGTIRAARHDLSAATVVVWDQHYSERGGISYRELVAPGSGWARQASYDNNRVIIFRRVAR